MNISAIEMGFGALIAVAGVVLFYLGKGSGQNRLVVFGQTVELSTPALVIILLGCVIFVMPALLPLWLGTHPDRTSGSSAVAPNPQTATGGTSGSSEALHQVYTRYQATLPGINAQITKFAHHGETALIEITFINTTDHDSDFCAKPDTWHITDEVNFAYCGWPLLSSGGDAICDSKDWKQMKPSQVAVAFAQISCPTGEDDTWSFDSPDLKQIIRGLRFERTR